MQETDLAMFAVVAIFASLAGTFLYNIWRRQWTGMGLVVALACLLGSAAHFQILVQMAMLPGYAEAPASVGSITWHTSPGLGSLLLGISLLFFAAMCAALRLVSRWAAPAICLASAYFLLSSGTGAVARWTATGELPSMSIGVVWPVWIGFPAFLLLILGPFLVAIPWSLMRQAQLAQGETRAVLLTQWLFLGTVVTLLTVFGAAFTIGVLQGTAGSDERSTRAALTLAGVVMLTIAAVVLTMIGSRRIFLVPAVSIIERIEANLPIGEAVKPGSIWEPVAKSLDRSGAELRDARALLQSFVDNIPMALTVSDLSGKHVLVNPVAARHHGASMESMVSADPEDNFAERPDEFQRYLELGRLVAETGETQVIEITTHSAQTGKDAHSLVTFFPLFDSKGEVIQLGTIATNITELREAERQLAQSNSALHQSEKLAALGQLLAGVSHELNNPLAAVIGQASLLAEDLEGTEHADRVSKIRRAADRCARIVQSFLAMARQKAPEIRTVAINDLVQQAAELTEYQMRAGGVLVELQLAEDLPAVEVDPDQMHQVIVNLLTNARQAMEGNQGERRLTIATSRQRGRVKLRIADNGKGIAPEVRARIFDPFFSTKDVGSGTGIGLSYSLGIVEAHGGKLELEETEPGTSFAITLPVAKGQVLTDDQDEGGEEQTKGRVLVIDDEEDIADTLRDMLARMGLEVTVALGGKAGLQALEVDARFDLVISDIRMPEVDGAAVHGWIAAHRPELLGRIAFVTGDTLGDHAAQFLAAAQCPVLEKPFSNAALRDLVERMLQP